MIRRLTFYRAVKLSTRIAQKTGRLRQCPPLPAGAPWGPGPGSRPADTNPGARRGRVALRTARGGAASCLLAPRSGVEAGGMVVSSGRLSCMRGRRSRAARARPPSRGVHALPRVFLFRPSPKVGVNPSWHRIFGALWHHDDYLHPRTNAPFCETSAGSTFASLVHR
jgi:hypothetical protein